MRLTHHEITFDKVYLVRQTFSCSVAGRPLDLIVVVVQARDVRTGESGYLSRWSTHATADVQNLHVSSQSHHER